MKTPVREIVHDYIRHCLSGLDCDEAKKVCDKITEFCRTLTDAIIDIEASAVALIEYRPRNAPYRGSGTISLQK